MKVQMASLAQLSLSRQVGPHLPQRTGSAQGSKEDTCRKQTKDECDGRGVQVPPPNCALNSARPAFTTQRTLSRETGPELKHLQLVPVPTTASKMAQESCVLSPNWEAGSVGRILQYEQPRAPTLEESFQHKGQRPRQTNREVRRPR